MKFSDISFKNKIFILLLLPLLGFLAFSALLIKQNYATSDEMQQLTQLTQLSISNSELVHELQKERGATAGFIGSKGTTFTKELREQRQSTDEKLQALTTFLQQSDFEQSAVNALNQN